MTLLANKSYAAVPVAVAGRSKGRNRSGLHQRVRHIIGKLDIGLVCLRSSHNVVIVMRVKTRVWSSKSSKSKWQLHL
jgi:hypothetical protein